MGTDIHGIFQAKKDGAWVDIPHEWEEERDYFLFAWLAGVRNGRGFAGVYMHEPIEPLSEPRGLPEDFGRCPDDADIHPTALENYDPRRRGYRLDADETGYWMGYHDHSWLTSAEILSGPRPCAVQHRGVVSLEQFEKWDGKSCPQEYCGSIVGRDVVVSSPNSIGPTTTHVEVSWDEDAGESLAYFINEVKRLHDEHGEVRLVFGFDS